MSSYASAVAETALLGDTIGANLDATVARFGDREVLVDCPSGRQPWLTTVSTSIAPLRLTPTNPSSWVLSLRNNRFSPCCRAALAMPPMSGAWGQT